MPWSHTVPMTEAEAPFQVRFFWWDETTRRTRSEAGTATFERFCDAYAALPEAPNFFEEPAAGAHVVVDANGAEVWAERPWTGSSDLVPDDEIPF